METEFLEACGPAGLMFATVNNKKDPDLNKVEGRDQYLELSSDLHLQGLTYPRLALNSLCTKTA